MRKSPSVQLSSWSAVLRGRLPALLVLTPKSILSYAEDIYTGVNDIALLKEERKRCLGAVITGDIVDIPNGRGLFRVFIPTCQSALPLRYREHRDLLGLHLWWRKRRF
jgi:hypothetical protein